MKKISILGSTGSIGTQTLALIRERKDFKVTALAAKTNITLLEQQAREFFPSFVCVFEEKAAKELKQKLADTNIRVYAGMDGLVACATEEETELVVAAVVGMIGILPALEAIRAGKTLALANKETLVTAGHLIMPVVKEKGVRLLPIDSEHSAIFQALQGSVDYFTGEHIERIDTLILTASGGPFRGKKREELREIQVADALKHPNWSMGKKITIDSATMVNKGLEVMEAGWLFSIPPEKIQVVIQPQSIIHSAVAFVDGSVIAQMGLPDMKIPIQYALYYPERIPLKGNQLDFYALGSLDFEKPDYSVFTGLSLAYEAMRTGGSMPTVYNAANECAVEKFLNHEISFLDIAKLIEFAMQNHKKIENPNLNQILETEKETYDWIKERC